MRCSAAFFSYKYLKFKGRVRARERIGSPQWSFPSCHKARSLHLSLWDSPWLLVLMTASEKGQDPKLMTFQMSVPLVPWSESSLKLGASFRGISELRIEVHLLFSIFTCNLRYSRKGNNF